MYRTVLLFSGMTIASVLLGLLVAPARAQQEQEIRLGDFTIEPSSFIVAAGDTVRFRVINQGAREHNLEVELESAGVEHDFFAANLQPGQSDVAEVTFSEPGTWVLYCPVGTHRDRGMIASVEVQETGAAPAPQPMEAAPQAPAAPAAPAVPAAPAPPPVPKRPY
jgi:uncharacterized cupredoxin-like copper-binding protein